MRLCPVQTLRACVYTRQSGLTRVFFPHFPAWFFCLTFPTLTVICRIQKAVLVQTQHRGSCPCLPRISHWFSRIKCMLNAAIRRLFVHLRARGDFASVIYRYVVRLMYISVFISHFTLFSRAKCEMNTEMYDWFYGQRDLFSSRQTGVCALSLYNAAWLFHLYERKKLSHDAIVFDTSTKLEPLCSPLDSLSNELHFTSLAPIQAELRCLSASFIFQPTRTPGSAGQLENK